MLVITVIFVVPVPTPVTFPFPSTFAMFSSSLFHVNVLSSVVSLGLIIACKVSLVPFVSVISVLLSIIVSIGFGSSLIVIPFIRNVLSDSFPHVL